MDNSYDVVVVGGGAAGLSGALALGRSRRSVLVIDAGDPRNASAGHVHNYLGREGTPPGDLLAIGRDEVAQYGVQVMAGRVLAASRHEDGLFTVTVQDREGPNRDVRARRLLVTTGVIDVLPDLPGLAESWGSTVVHCPYCHGWEVRDQAIGVLCLGPMSVHQVKLFRQLSSDVVLFLHTAKALTDEESEQLAARDIRVVEGEVAGWKAGGVRMTTGELVARDVLAVSSQVRARDEFLWGLGLKSVDFEIGGNVVGTYVPADPTGRTDAAGVWVAGNVASPMAQVIGSAAAGLMAGAAMNADLIEEETEHAVAQRRFFSAEAWEERYREKTGGRWSGNPNPVLVAEASDLAAGRALDVGCGEGADALWLAERGWRVTGVDISTVALGRAAAHAAGRGLEVDWQHVDLLATPPAAGAYELVSAHFMQLPEGQRIALYEHLAAAVAPGGTLLIVGHHPVDMHAPMRRAHQHDMFFTADQLVAQLDPNGWDVLVAEARPRQAMTPEGEHGTLHDAVLLARRR
jgi:thioredoxin reductase/SAM-dependent methyltransferase